MGVTDFCPPIFCGPLHIDILPTKSGCLRAELNPKPRSELYVLVVVRVDEKDGVVKAAAHHPAGLLVVDGLLHPPISQMNAMVQDLLYLGLLSRA